MNDTVSECRHSSRYCRDSGGFRGNTGTALQRELGALLKLAHFSFIAIVESCEGIPTLGAGVGKSALPLAKLPYGCGVPRRTVGGFRSVHRSVCAVVKETYFASTFVVVNVIEPLQVSFSAYAAVSGLRPGGVRATHSKIGDGNTGVII